MTNSEKICNKLGEKFFAKDFVYENLMYRNSTNNKIELCDALFEYGNMYLAIQIKERAKVTNGKSEEQWLKETVYNNALIQIHNTVSAIKTENIVVNDLYHQKVEINKNYTIYPIIVFDNSSVLSYERILVDGNETINIFSLKDFYEMMNEIIHPYDIFYYLQERKNWLRDKSGLPNIVFGETIDSTIIAKIETEKDFAEFFKRFAYNCDQQMINDALRLLAIINTFKERQIKNVKDYKTILKLLQLIEPKKASGFIERFNYAWTQACENKFDFSKCIQIKHENKITDIVFFSVGWKGFEDFGYYEILCDAKQLQHRNDCVLLICFIGGKDNTCQIDWFYWDKHNDYDEKLLQLYQKIGMYEGLVSREIYEELCKNIFK